MKTSLFLLLVALLFPLSLAAQNFGAQTTQNLKESKPAEHISTPKDSPELLGLRLGMSIEETREAAPNLGLSNKKRRNEIGVSFSLSSRPNDEAAGVVNTYLDDKLVEIDILFNPPIKWSSITEFVRELSMKLNLPLNAWKIDGSNARYTSMSNDFTIEIRDLNHVILSDKAAKTEIKRRMTEKVKIP